MSDEGKIVDYVATDASEAPALPATQTADLDSASRHQPRTESNSTENGLTYTLVEVAPGRWRVTSTAVKSRDL
jgi:hypothetical protein